MGGGIEKARNFHAGFFMTNGCLRRDGWQWFSSMQVWEQLVNQTKRSSRDHAALAEIYSTHISQRCTNITEDIQRMHKKVCIFRLLRFHAAQVHQWIFCFLFFRKQCRHIGYEIHEEVLKVLHELHTAMKTHHNYQSEYRLAETKLQVNDLIYMTFAFSSSNSS